MTLMEQFSTQISETTFAMRNGVNIDAIEPDTCTGHVDYSPELKNPYGILHGAAYFTLADMICAISARTDGRRYVTQSSNVSFVRAVSSGRVTGVGRVINRGRSVCLAEARITDEQGKLCFYGTFTFFCISK